MRWNRRTVLKGALSGLSRAGLSTAGLSTAGLATAGLATAGLSSTLLLGAGCGGRTMPTSVTPALLRQRVSTVVVLMMENRSFDHVFGALSLLEGRSDVDGLTADMLNLKADGTPVAVNAADQACLGTDPGHGWSASHEQWANGANSGFVTNYEQRAPPEEVHRVMGYLDRSWQPVSYALADQGALCQRWFASVMGPTWPNRYYSQLASSDGHHSNDIVTDAFLPTVYGRLDEQNVGWSSYYGNLPFSALFPGHSVETDEYQALDAFFTDAEAGSLRPVVWLDPIYGRADDHPPAHPLAGQVLIGSVYEALRQGPHGDSFLLVVTYDEHGGFFDHVPPVATTGDPFAGEGFDISGFRVPTFVVGPYVKRQVSSTVFDHTSIIATLCRLHGCDPLNERDAAASDVLSLLDEERLLSGTPERGAAAPVVDVSDDVLFGPTCVSGLPFSASLGQSLGLSLGQPELERAFTERYGTSHPKDLRRDTDRALQLLVERARKLGVLA